MRRTKQIRWILAAILLIAVPAARAEFPAVLRQVPEDAQIILALPRLSGLSKKLAIVNQKLDLNHLHYEQCPRVRQRHGRRLRPHDGRGKVMCDEG